MKKVYLLFTVLFTVGFLSVFYSCKDDDGGNNIISYEALPTESKKFISDHFSDCDATKTFEQTSGYTVSLTKRNTSSTLGYEIEFDRQGGWIEIEGRDDVVLPDNVLALMPRAILSYVKQNYAARGVCEIKKESYGYKIELAGKPDVELMFDIDGAYISKGVEDATIAYDQLPAVVKTFLTTHFNGLTPSKIEKDGDSYDIKYANKVEVEFDLLGKWTEVDANGNQMPQTIIALLPNKLTEYLHANYASKQIEEIKNKISSYEIELFGDIDLIFDREGNLWDSGGNQGSDDGQRVAFSALPQSIQSFLNQHLLSFTQFLYAEKDKDEYEVKLVNGTDVDFYLTGGLKSIEVLPGNKVPDSIILPEILSYVKANYSTKQIEEYEVKPIGFKVELSGYPEIELLFDTNGGFKGID